MTGLRSIRMPMSREEARSLRAGDMVLLDGEIVITAGLPTVQRLVACAEEGRAPPIPLAGGSLMHLGSYSRDTADGGLEVLYMNPTTSTRFAPNRSPMRPKAMRPPMPASPSTL